MCDSAIVKGPDCEVEYRKREEGSGLTIVLVGEGGEEKVVIEVWPEGNKLRLNTIRGGFRGTGGPGFGYFFSPDDEHVRVREGVID